MRTGTLAAIIVALSIAAVYATATASAQAGFGWQDASLDAFPPVANAWADLTGGSLEIVDDKTLRATITVAFLPEPRAGVAYGFMFSDGTNEHYAALVNEPDGTFYVAGRWEGDEPGRSESTTGTYTLGPGGVITIDVPIALLGNATELSAPRGLTGELATFMLPVGGGAMFLDEAVGEGTLKLPAKPAPPPSADLATPTPDVTTQEEGADVAPAETIEQPKEETPGVAPLLLLATLAGLALTRSRRA